MSTDPVRRLKTLGRDLTTIPLSRFPETMGRACFICVNTYRSYRLSLGTGPINDAVSFAKIMKMYDFQVYFLHNPHSRNFMTYLDKFFEKTTEHLVVYYVGHGTNVTDLDGDEADHQDEAFVFDDGNITDDTLIAHLIEKKNEASKLTLVTDACHSGSIWDIQGGDVNGRTLPPNILSLSAASDAQTAKQTTINRQDQGIFTYNLYKVLKAQPNLTPQQIQTQMRKALRRYGQSIIVGTTTDAFLTQPLFDD